MAYGILVPQPGIEAVLWAVKGQAPKDWALGNSQSYRL